MRFVSVPVGVRRLLEYTCDACGKQVLFVDGDKADRQKAGEWKSLYDNGVIFMMCGARCHTQKREERREYHGVS